MSSLSTTQSQDDTVSHAIKTHQTLDHDDSVAQKLQGQLQSSAYTTSARNYGVSTVSTQTQINPLHWRFSPPFSPIRVGVWMTDSKFISMTRRHVFDPSASTTSSSSRTAKKLLDLSKPAADNDEQEEVNTDQARSQTIQPHLVEFVRIDVGSLHGTPPASADLGHLDNSMTSGHSCNYPEVDVVFYKTSEALIGDLFYDHAGSRQEVAAIQNYISTMAERRISDYEQHLQRLTTDVSEEGAMTIPPRSFPVREYQEPTLDPTLTSSETHWHDEAAQSLASIPKPLPLVIDPFAAVVRTMCRAQLHNTLLGIKFKAYTEDLTKLKDRVPIDESTEPFRFEIKIPKGVLLYLPPPGAEPNPEFYATQDEATTCLSPSRPASVRELLNDPDLSVVPLIVKSVPASGSSESHSIMVLPPLAEVGKPLPNVESIENKLRKVLPYGLFYISRYIHHPQRVYKVYVLHPEVHVAARASVPNSAVPDSLRFGVDANESMPGTQQPSPTAPDESASGSPSHMVPLVFDSQRMEFYHIKKSGPISYGTHSPSLSQVDPLCEAPGVARLLPLLPIAAFNPKYYDDPDRALEILRMTVLEFSPSSETESVLAQDNFDAMLRARLRRYSELGIPLETVPSAIARHAFAHLHDKARTSSQEHQAKVSARRQKKAESLSEHARAMLAEANMDPRLYRRQTAVKAALESIATQLHTSLGLTMFGFDAVESSDSNAIYIVDVNYFPSFQSMEDVPGKFADLIVREYTKHCSHSAAQFLASTLAPSLQRASVDNLSNSNIVKSESLEAKMPSAITIDRPIYGATATSLLAALPETVAILGYGSLLAPGSAKITCPGLFNFQPALLPGYARVFSLASINALKLVRDMRSKHPRVTEGAMVTTGESGSSSDDEWWKHGPLTDESIAAVSAVPLQYHFSGKSANSAKEGKVNACPLFVSLFWIGRTDLVPYLLREQRYQFTTANAYLLNQAQLNQESMSNMADPIIPTEELPPGFELTGLSPRHLQVVQRSASSDIPGTEAMSCVKITGVVCTESTDTLLKLRMSSMFHYHDSVTQHYEGKLWACKTLKPGTRYLQFCLRAAYELGGDWGYQNFINTSWLADSSALGDYIAQYPDAFSLDAICKTQFQVISSRMQQPSATPSSAGARDTASASLPTSSPQNQGSRNMR